MQDGSEGWRVAQESDVISGCAPELRGEMALNPAGRVSSLFGNSVGEMNGLEI